MSSATYTVKNRQIPGWDLSISEAYTLISSPEIDTKPTLLKEIFDILGVFRKEGKLLRRYKYIVACHLYAAQSGVDIVELLDTLETALEVFIEHPSEE